MNPRFLLDEHVPALIRQQIRRRNPLVEVKSIGEPGVPLKGTPDAEILDWLEEHDFVLVTENRRSMPKHIEEHYAEGKILTGILWLKPDAPISEIIEALLLRWETTTQEEYRHFMAYIPD